MYPKTLMMCGLLAALLWGCEGVSENKNQYTQADFQELRRFRRPLQDRLDALHDSLQPAFIDSLREATYVHPLHQLAVYRILNQYTYNKGYYADALFYVNRELELLDETATDGSYHPDSYFRRGDVYFDLRQYDMAFKEYTKGLEYGGANIEAQVQADFNHRIGQLSYRKGDFRKAIDYYQRSLKLFNSLETDRLPVKYRRQELCGNIALSHWRLKELDKSIAWYDSALVYVNRIPRRTARERLQHQIALQVILGNQGIVLYEKGQKELGLAQMERSMAFNKLPKGDRSHASFIAHQMAKYALEAKNLAQAKAFLDTAQSIVGWQPYSQATFFQEKTYLDYYALTGQTDSLKKHLGLFMQVNDSLKSYERSLATVNTDQLVAGLEKDFALKSEQAKNAAQQRLNAILISLLASLALGLGIIGWLWQKGKRKNQMLASLNKHISEQHALLEKAQLEQLETNDRLEQLNRQKDKLLRVVAHDLRNPLAAIYGLSGLLLEDEKSEHDREFLQLANQACRGGLDLIGELLDQPTGDKTHREIFSRRERIAALLFLNDTIRLVKHRAEEKHIDLELHCHYNDMLYVDIERMRRALTNLIINAIKFSARGQRVHVHCERKQDRVIFEVRDAGIGIPKDHLPRLFESFTTVKRAGTEGEKAFGLGLSITKQIAEEHHGEIQVESTEGLGSVFRLVVPATLPENN
jgi:signal transduction histidine kinase